VPKIVYIFTNPAMPDLVKIGVTSRNDETDAIDAVKQRLADLSQPTGVPYPFECHFAGEVPDQVNVEKLMHQIFAEYRINPKREFFRLAPEKAVLALRLAQAKDVTPAHQLNLDSAEVQAVDAEQARRGKTQLKALGILPGAELTLTRDSSIKCKVVEGNKVEYDGKILSTSAAALEALKKVAGFTATSVSGSDYWMFNDKTIWDIRMEKEQEKFDELE
jgi:hypothetical protein